MGIATKSGDTGTTGLMFNRRVSKCHPRVEACGGVDELNAAIGMARAVVDDAFVRDHLLSIQKDLVLLMGELAVAEEDLPRYLKEGYSQVQPKLAARLDALVKQLEAKNPAPKTWVLPGETVPSAAVDLARTACRRAERRVCGLFESQQLKNPEILTYLNRLSDVLWLLARWEEARLRPLPQDRSRLV